MHYNRLGSAGVTVSEISFGSWITFGNQMDLEQVQACLRTAFDHGVNFFDTAEVYAHGEAETLMGKALKDYLRSDLVISTKIFWGGDGPNDTGLSWKHLVEGTKSSLQRLQLDYVDLLFCHRPDPDTPVEETVRAMDHIIQSGLAFYWGTSEWSAVEIEQAHLIAREINAIPPVMEQPEYHLFHRNRVEKEYLTMIEKYGLGLTTWSPLNSGILTGKYNDGIPPGSRLEQQEWLRDKLLSEEKIRITRQLAKVADEIGCSLAQLAIAWCLKNPHVSTVITGATSIEQIEENVQAIEVKEKLTDEVMKKIDQSIII